jgi:hypothetical protein
MQVNQISDHVTHAVIGGHKAINFTISDDAELMNVLSKALYTDQQLAVIRETLCNAWDAHIEAGITDKPFWITLDNDELIIRDFGHGIPLDMIGPVYGTYGGSTKKMNGNVTGGFGLGCKAPFAFTDHFEVTSWNQGTMTVYNMSKSSAEVKGKPGIIPIVSVPTTETGLQVRIKLNHQNDRARFEKLIRRIAQNGEMNCTFNGAVLEKLPFDRVVHNFLITEKQLIETKQPILLRYGHVIYPIENDAAFADQYQQIIQILEKIPTHDGNRYCNFNYKIVFQAPPNSISITPSREALSMQEGTINTITKLLKDFLSIAEARLEKGCFDLLQTSIDQTWLNAAPKVLFETKNRIPNLRRQKNIEDVITDFDQFIVRYASYSYPEYPAFKQKDQMARVQALIDAGFGDRELLKQFQKRLQAEFEPKKSKETQPTEDWFKEHILDPLVSALTLDPSLNHDKLFLFCSEQKHSWDIGVKLIIPKNMVSRSLFKYFSWLRKIVVLAHNRIDFVDRATDFPIMGHWLGKVEDVFLYTVPRSPKKVEAAREFFKKQGYIILDLTIAQPWEAKDAAAPILKEYTSRPKRKGIPTLESCLVPATQNINMMRPNQEEELLIDTPEFILKANYKSDAHHLPHHSVKVSKFIINKWGKLGGFVVNSNQEAKYIAMGATLYEDFILEKIFEEFSNNPRIIESLPFMFERSKLIDERRWGSVRTFQREICFMNAVYADPDLVDYFGLVQTMNEDDQLFWAMWNEFKSEYRYGTKGFFKKIIDLLETIEVNQRVIDLFDLIRKSKLLNAFNPEQVAEYMIKPAINNINPVSSKQRLMLRDMLLEVIEG